MHSLITEYGTIILSSGCIYIFIVIAIRLSGKKELSQLSIVDLVFILLISNSVQNAMVGSNTTLPGGLVSAGSLFLINYLFKMAMYHFPKFSKILDGNALLLVYKGNINHKNMNKAKITRDELMEAIREHGVALIENVDLAVLEVDGNISILSNEFSKATIKKRRSPKEVAKNK